jgi:hypothetical protein
MELYYTLCKIFNEGEVIAYLVKRTYSWMGNRSIPGRGQWHLPFPQRPDRIGEQTASYIMSMEGPFLRVKRLRREADH